MYDFDHADKKKEKKKETDTKVTIVVLLRVFQTRFLFARLREQSHRAICSIFRWSRFFFRSLSFKPGDPNQRPSYWSNVFNVSGRGGNRVKSKSIFFDPRCLEDSKSKKCMRIFYRLTFDSGFPRLRWACSEYVRKYPSTLAKSSRSLHPRDSTECRRCRESAIEARVVFTSCTLSATRCFCFLESLFLIFLPFTISTCSPTRRTKRLVIKRKEIVICNFRSLPVLCLFPHTASRITSARRSRFTFPQFSMYPRESIYDRSTRLSRTKRVQTRRRTD